MLPAVLVAVVTFLVCWTATYFVDPFPDGDSFAYWQIAEGRIKDVNLPAGNRWLVPLTVGMTSGKLHVPLWSVWLSLSIVSGLVYAWTVARVTAVWAGSAWLALLLLASPITWGLQYNYVLPDLYHATLVGLFFLCLARKWWVPAVLILLTAQVARESTSLLAFVSAFVLWRWRFRWQAGAAIAAFVLGTLITGRVARYALPDLHGMGSATYMAMKVPFNASRNVLGLMLWSNTLEHTKGNPPPIWAFDLPSWIKLGAVRRVGFSGFEPWYPLWTAYTLLSVFGVLPTLLIGELRRRRRQRKRRDNCGPIDAPKPLALWEAIAIPYGLIAFFLAPALGASLDRLTAYAWPAFLLATPAVLAMSRRFSRARLATLIMLQLTAVWLPTVVFLRLEGTWPVELAVVVVLVAVHIAAARTTAKSMKKSGISNEDRSLTGATEVSPAA